MIVRAFMSTRRSNMSVQWYRNCSSGGISQHSVSASGEESVKAIGESDIEFILSNLNNLVSIVNVVTCSSPNYPAARPKLHGTATSSPYSVMDGYNRPRSLNWAKLTVNLLPALTPNTDRAPEDISRINGALDLEEARVVAAPEGFLPVWLVHVALAWMSAWATHHQGWRARCLPH